MLKSYLEYIDDYLDMYNNLKKKNEIWRLAHQPQEFARLLTEKFDEWAAEDADPEERKTDLVSRTIKIKMLMECRMTDEEVEKNKEKIARQNADREIISRAKMRDYIVSLRMPVSDLALIDIYNALWREVVTLDMIDFNVLMEFAQTRQFRAYMKKLKKDNNIS